MAWLSFRSYEIDWVRRIGSSPPDTVEELYRLADQRLQATGRYVERI